MTPGDLMTIRCMATELGISDSSMCNRMKRDPGFPAPWGKWPGLRMWHRSDFERWANR